MNSLVSTGCSSYIDKYASANACLETSHQAIKEGKSFEKIKLSINDAITYMKITGDPKDKEYKTLIRRLTVQLNALENRGNEGEVKEIHSMQKKVSDLAHKAGVVRSNDLRVAKFRRNVKKVIQMMSSENRTKESLKILSEDYWIEFFDKHHRHPKAVSDYFNEWKIYHQHEMDFWSFLAEKEGDSEIDFSEAVTFLTPEERKKYRCKIEMNEDGNIVIKNSEGKVLKDGGYITVLGPDNNFYIAKKVAGKFQHSSFFAAKSVASAGIFAIKDGRLNVYLSHSGHYKPGKQEMCKILKRLEEIGVDISKFELHYGAEEYRTEIENPKEWSVYKDFLSGNRLEKTAAKTAQSTEEILRNISDKNSIEGQSATVVEKAGGGFYNKRFGAVFPVKPMELHAKWESKKNKIARRIGKMDSGPILKSMYWENSSKTEDELLSDAKVMSGSFYEACHDIAKKTGSRANFGINDAAIVKAKESLSRKVASDAKATGVSKEVALSKIGDALRGTIVVDLPEKIPSVIKEIKEYAHAKGGEVIFKNLWEQSRQSGYVGVHAKLYMPIPSDNGDGENKHLLVELQIHLDAIMDGTEKCVKEIEHKFYERTRSGEFDANEIAPASKLLYLTAMKNVKKIN